MTNKEFLIEVQKSCHLEMSQCLMLMGCFQKMLGKAAVDQVAVALPGLGVFTSHKHPEYIQEDATTGAMTLYPPRISYRLQSEYCSEVSSCAELLAEYAKVEPDDASAFVASLVDTIKSHLGVGEELEAPGLGIFKYVVTHNSDLKHVDYLPSDQMKELVNAPFNCFEPVVVAQAKDHAEVVADLTTQNEVSVEIAKEVISEVLSTEDNSEEIQRAETTEQTDVVDGSLETALSETPQESPEGVSKKEEAKTDTPIVKPVVSTTDNESRIIKKGDRIIIKQDEDLDASSTKWTLYVALALIMMGCGFVLWLIFSNDTDFWADPPAEAKVVDAGKPLTELIAAVDDMDTVKIDSVIVATAHQEKIAKPESEPTAPNSALTIEDEPKPSESKQANSKPTESNSSIPLNKDLKPAETAKSESKKNDLTHRMIGADGKPVTVKLAAGSRLTLIALEHFGDKSFWPYIYDVNTDKLKAPNLVQSGMVLYLPDPSYFGIDANDRASVRRAKNRAAQLLK